MSQACGSLWAAKLVCPESLIRSQYAARVSSISLADLVHANGLGSLFHSLTHLRMSVSRLMTLRCADLRSFRFVSSANHRSINRLLGVESGVVSCSVVRVRRCRWAWMPVMVREYRATPARARPRSILW